MLRDFLLLTMGLVNREGYIVYIIVGFDYMCMCMTGTYPRKRGLCRMAAVASASNLVLTRRPSASAHRGVVEALYPAIGV